MSFMVFCYREVMLSAIVVLLLRKERLKKQFNHVNPFKSKGKLIKSLGLFNCILVFYFCSNLFGFLSLL